MPNIFRTVRPTNFELGARTKHEDPHHRQAPWRQGRKVTWRVWQVLADTSRTKHLGNTKIGRKAVHPTGNNAHQFQVQRSRSPGRMLRLAGSASYLPNWKAYELHTWYTDGTRRHTSAVKGHQRSRSRDTSDRCWPISQERNILETPKLVGRLPTWCVIMCTRFEAKRSKFKFIMCLVGR